MSYIYVAGTVDGKGPCKIGRSIDPDSRLSGLQTGNPERIEILHREEVIDAALVERRVHAYLDKAHIWGEWFAVDATDATNAIVAITNWPGKLSDTSPFIKALARTVEAFMPPQATIEQALTLALLIAQEPDWQKAHAEFFSNSAALTSATDLPI